MTQEPPAASVLNDEDAAILERLLSLLNAYATIPMPWAEEAQGHIEYLHTLLPQDDE